MMILVAQGFSGLLPFKVAEIAPMLLSLSAQSVATDERTSQDAV
jgi:hypothetical protein